MPAAIAESPRVITPERIPTPSTELTAGFSVEQVDLIKRNIAPGATDDELKLFLWQCQRTGLDPFTRQIYLIPRKSKDENGDYVERQVSQTSIDGFRVVASRNPHYAGQLGPFWCGEDGEWKEVWAFRKQFKNDKGEVETVNIRPYAAKVGILRSDFKEPLWNVAHLHNYAAYAKDGSLTGQWPKMPEVMIAKCAEATALRRAFPNDLSGLYTDDEMEQARNEAAAEAVATIIPAKVQDAPQAKPRQSRTTRGKPEDAPAAETTPAAVVAPAAGVKELSNAAAGVVQAIDATKALDTILRLQRELTAKLGKDTATSYFKPLAVLHKCATMGKEGEPQLGCCPVETRAAMIHDLETILANVKPPAPAADLQHEMGPDGWPRVIASGDIQSLLRDCFNTVQFTAEHRELIKTVTATWHTKVPSKDLAVTGVTDGRDWEIQAQLAGSNEPAAIRRAFYIDMAKRIDALRKGKGIVTK